MTLTEAIISCREGNFVTHKYFDSEQSMHMWRHHLYYEDGVDLTAMEFNLSEQEWANNDGWEIKYTKDEVTQQILDFWHKDKRYLKDKNFQSFECCVVKNNKSKNFILL